LCAKKWDRSGAIELLMPAIQPAELWQERRSLGCIRPADVKIKDRHETISCFGRPMKSFYYDIARREFVATANYRSLVIKFKPSFATKSDRVLV